MHATHSIAEFPCSDATATKVLRILATVLLFVAAAFLFWWGEDTSLFEPGYGAGLAEKQNLAVNLFSALACLLLGFLNLLWIWKNESIGPASILVLEDRIIAPKQGILNKPVEMHFSDITQLRKLSVDGIWEFNVHSRNKHIRVPKASLQAPEDFERMIACVQQMAKGPRLETKQRIDPPHIST